MGQQHVMSKKLCKEYSELEAKGQLKKNKYRCNKCKLEAPKEKWCCKPKKLKR